MNLTRALCSLDLECTTLDPMTSRIVEMGMWFLYPDGTRKGGSRRFNPGCPIPPESTEVHGITDADVADCPPFAASASKVLASLHGKDLLGYNLRRLDLPLLDEEARRAGLRLDLEPDQLIIDCYGIFAKKESRTLADAVLKYTGVAHEGAHGAGADAAATINVLLGQLAVYEDLGALSLEDLAKFSRHGEFDYIDIAGKLYRDAEGDMCFAFGTHRGAKVKTRLPYCDWILGPKASFPGSTTEALLAELRMLGI